MLQKMRLHDLNFTDSPPEPIRGEADVLCYLTAPVMQIELRGYQPSFISRWPGAKCICCIRVMYNQQLRELAGLILSVCPANERRHYKVTPSLIGWAQIRISPELVRSGTYLSHCIHQSAISISRCRFPKLGDLIMRRVVRLCYPYNWNIHIA